MNTLKNNQVLIFPGPNISARPRTPDNQSVREESREHIEKLYVELMYCRSESASAELKFVTYLLDLACEALREALPPDDLGAAG